MNEGGVDAQRKAMDQIYSDRRKSRWQFHYTDDPLVRYLRDRRLHLALRVLGDAGRLDPKRQSVLVACGGVGGEGTFLLDQGFEDVTVSDISTEALTNCRSLDPRLKTLHLDAEAMTLEEASFDLVLVQDGLHHLPRPALGLTEMLRVARDAAIVIEPHYGLIGSLLGTVWERHGEAKNYVFRWSRQSFLQVTKSYLLSEQAPVYTRRFWDHNLAVAKAVGRLPVRHRLRGARVLYAMLSPVNRIGNMFVGVSIKPTEAAPQRLTSH